MAKLSLNSAMTTSIPLQVKTALTLPKKVMKSIVSTLDQITKNYSVQTLMNIKMAMEKVITYSMPSKKMVIASTSQLLAIFSPLMKANSQPLITSLHQANTKYLSSNIMALTLMTSMSLQLKALLHMKSLKKLKEAKASQSKIGVTLKKKLTQSLLDQITSTHLMDILIMFG